jgi:hypothetical protein
MFAICLGTSSSACHVGESGAPGESGVSCPALSYIAGDACVAFPPFSDATLFLEQDVTVAADAGVDDSAPAGDAPQDAAPPADADAGTFDLVCDAGVPIPECVEYYELLGACTGGDYLETACQTAADTDASERASITQLCTVNVQRIQQACR